MSEEAEAKALQRISYLYEVANEEGVFVKPESERDLRMFLSGITPSVPSIFLDDEGVFSVVWETQGTRLGLRFPGGRTIRGTVLPERLSPST